MKRHGNWVIKVLLVVLAALWLGVVAASWSEAAEGSSGESDEYNFSWLDPDKKIYVLQNRRYTKAHKLNLSLSAGLGDTSAYRTSYSLSPRIGYYMTEHFGFEILYQMLSNKNNNTYNALHEQSPALAPNVLEIKNQLAALVTWAPWYAKINVFNWVLYFDWYFTGGLGTLSTNVIPGSTSSAATTKSFTGYYLGTGQMFHIDESWIVRLDFTNVFFKAPQSVTSGKEVFYNSTTFEIGVGLKL